MPELLIDFITSLDGYAAADGWPGWWGLEGPDYLAWLGQAPEADYTVLIRATVYVTVEGVGESARSRVAIEINFEGHGVGRLIVPLFIRPQAAKEMPANLRRLKQRLEGSEASQR